MFRSAANKIAHNTTLPSLGTNADLRPLQDLITLEKTVIISLQKLSADYGKAADALKLWGQNEGEDLGSILGASGNLLAQWASALSQYASHGHVIREDLKSIRSREEALDELKRRRRAVHRKADDAEKKLSKMGPEHKNLATQVELLNRLKDEIRGLDSEIMSEESALGDYKRSCTRSWLGLKFGGLLELSEKGTIAGEFGKLLVAEIPEEFTQPGMPRSLFHGHPQVENLQGEALRCINQVSMSGQPPSSAGSQPPYLQTNLGHNQPPGSAGFTPTTATSSHLPPSLPPLHHEETSFDTPRPSAFSTNTLPLPPKGHFMDQPTGGAGGVDEFGMPVAPKPQAQPVGISTTFDAPSAAGGRFATFPVKRQETLPTIDAPFARSNAPEAGSLHSRQEISEFSADLADALDAREGDGLSDQKAAHAWRGRLSGEASLISPTPPAPAAPAADPQGLKAVHFVDNAWTDEPMTPSKNEDINSKLTQRRQTHSFSEEGSAILAYMTANDGDLPDSPESANGKIPLPATTKKNEAGHPKRMASPPPPTPSSPLTENAVQHSSPTASQINEKGHLDPSKDKTSSPITQEKSAMSHRVPPPTFMSEEEEERAKNVEALKSVSLELKDFTLPSLSFPGSPSKETDSLTRSRSNTNDQFKADSPTTSTGRQPSPLSPPSVAFSHQTVSPKPSFDASQARAPVPDYSSPPPAPPSPPSAPAPVPTAAQSIMHSYQAKSQGTMSSVDSAGSGKYPNPYDIPTDTYPTPTQSNLPPRMQGQNTGDPGIPPRFQALRSPYERELPPRLQSPVESANAMPIGSAFSSAQSTPFRTPNEYPNMGTPLGGPGLSQSPPLPQPAPPFAQPMRAPPSPVLSTGTGKISAAAFKRPSPLPGRGDGGPSSPINSYAPGLPSHPAQNRSFSPPAAQPLPPPSSPPQQQYHPASPPQQYQQVSSPPQQYQPIPAPPQQGPYPYVQPPVRQGSLPYPQSPPQQPHSQPPPPPQPSQMGRDLPPPGAAAARPMSSVSDDFGYDYISAYQDRSGQGSPTDGNFGGRTSQRNSGQQYTPLPNPNEYGGGPGGYPQQQPQQPGAPPSLQVGQVMPARFAQAQGYASPPQGHNSYLPPGAAPSQPQYGTRYGGDMDGGLR